MMAHCRETECVDGQSSVITARLQLRANCKSRLLFVFSQVSGVLYCVVKCNAGMEI